MLRALRLWSLLLVPGGFVAGHELGYQVATAAGAPPVVSGGHGYLVTLVLVATPFGLAAVARSALAGLRDELPPARFRHLLAGQVALFVAVELGEHAAAGMQTTETIRQPAVLLGLAAQVAVAALLVAILRTSHRAGVAVAAARRRRTDFPQVARRSLPGAARVMVPVVVPVTTLSRRGPPGLRVL